MRGCRLSHRSAAFLPTLTLVVGLLAVGAHLPRARAGCVGGEPHLTWSFPADGAAAVPTDAVLWTLATLGTRAVAARVGDVTLTEVSEEDDGARRFDFAAIGGLAPETDYEVAVDVATWGWSEGPTATVAVRFRTGSGPAEEAPPAAVVVGHRQVDDEDYSGPTHPLERCRDVTWAQECYDTGPRATLSFHVVAPTAPAFVVIAPHDDHLGLPPRVLWPGECGAPEVFASTGWFWDEPRRCFDLRAAGANGQLGPATTYCGEFAPVGMGGVDRWEPETDGGAADAGAGGAGPDGGAVDVGRDAGAAAGCAAGGASERRGGGGAPLALALVAGLALALARRRVRPAVGVWTAARAPRTGAAGRVSRVAGGAADEVARAAA